MSIPLNELKFNTITHSQPVPYYEYRVEYKNSLYVYKSSHMSTPFYHNMHYSSGNINGNMLTIQNAHPYTISRFELVNLSNEPTLASATALEVTILPEVKPVEKLEIVFPQPSQLDQARAINMIILLTVENSTQSKPIKIDYQPQIDEITKKFNITQDMIFHRLFDIIEANENFKSHGMLSNIIRKRYNEILETGSSFKCRMTKSRNINESQYLLYIEILSKVAIATDNVMRLCEEFVEFYPRAMPTMRATTTDMNDIIRIENYDVRSYLLEKLADYIKF